MRPEEDLLILKEEVLKLYYNKKNTTEFLDFIETSLRNTACKIISYGKCESVYNVLVRTNNSLIYFKFSEENISFFQFEIVNLRRFYLYDNTTIKVLYNDDTATHTRFGISFDDFKQRKRTIEALMNIFN